MDPPFLTTPFLTILGDLADLVDLADLADLEMDLVDLGVDLGGFSGFGADLRVDLVDLADLGVDLVDLGADFVRKGIARKGGSAYGRWMDRRLTGMWRGLAEV